MLGFLAAALIGSTCFGLLRFRQFVALQGASPRPPPDMVIELLLGVALGLVSVFGRLSKLRSARREDLLGRAAPSKQRGFPNFVHNRSLLFGPQLRAEAERRLGAAA